MKLQVSRIALLSLLSVIPLAANDDNAELLADFAMEHPNVETNEGIDNASSIAASLQMNVENIDGEGSANIEEIFSVDNTDPAEIHDDSDHPALNTNEAENDIGDISVSNLPTQAQHEQINNHEDGHVDNKDESSGASDINVGTAQDSVGTSPESAVQDEIPDKKEQTDHTTQEETDSNATEEEISLQEKEIDGNDGTAGIGEEKSSKDADKDEKEIQSEVNDPGSVDQNEQKDEERSRPVKVDYANKSTGALILDKSKDFQGTSNLLVADKDKYAMIPCDKEGVKYVIIGLSEEILVKSIQLFSYEKFSSRTKHFEVLGSQTYPVMEEWEELGTFDAKPWYKENKEQSFELIRPSWARYLKFRFLDHYGDEHYCAYTQIKVHGSTTLQGFHEMQAEIQAEADAEAEAEAEAIKSDLDEELAGSSDSTLGQEVESKDIDSESVDVAKDDDEQSKELRKEKEESSSKGMKQSDEGSTDHTSESTAEKNTTENQDKSEVQLQEEILTETSIKNQDRDELDDGATGEARASESKAAVTAEEVVADLNQSDSLRADESEPTINKDGAIDERDSNESDSTQALVSEEDLATKNDSDAPPANADDVESMDAGNGGSESMISSSSSVKDAMNSAINTLKKPSIMKDAVKGIHQIIKAKTANEDHIANENITEELKTDSLSHVENDAQNESNPTTEAESGIGEEDLGAIDVENRGFDSGANADVDVPEDSDSEESQSQTRSQPDVTPADSSNANNSKNSGNSVNNDTTSKDAAEETEMILSQLSTRFPRAACLDYLDFADFKKSMIESGNLKLKGSSTRTGEKHKQNEPIFVKLTDEIKGLEASQNVYEQYIKAATSCYQRVILDLGTELASTENKQEARLSNLEEQIRKIGEKSGEMKKEPGVALDDIVLAVKTIFATVMFPTFFNWYTCLSTQVSGMIDKIIVNEYVQKLVFLVGMYEQFLSGIIVCYIFIVLTNFGRVRVQKKREKKQTRITKRRKLSKINVRSKKAGKEGMMEVLIPVQQALNQRTDEDESSF